MTDNEASVFIDQVLKGLWSSWEPGDLEIEIWTKELRPCDYGRAKQSISNWHVTATQPYRKPPLGKLRQILRKSRVESSKKKEPVKLFTVCLDAMKKRGYDFYAPDKDNLPSQEEIERRAESDRKQVSALRGCEAVIRY